MTGAEALNVRYRVGEARIKAELARVWRERYPSRTCRQERLLALYDAALSRLALEETLAADLATKAGPDGRRRGDVTGVEPAPSGTTA